MALTSQCRLLFWCPYCKQYYGGIAEGNIWKSCRWCNKDCDKRGLPVEERNCKSDRCIMHMVLGVDPARLKVGEPER